VLREEVAFTSLRHNIAPSTPSGRPMFQIIAILGGHPDQHLAAEPSKRQVASDCANQREGSSIARHEMVRSVICCAHYS
jgi:hypothetical protein